MKRLAIALLLALLAPVTEGEVEETRATLRQHALALINRDRAIYNLAPVELDLAASVTGDEYCREQIRTRSTGHYSTSGLAPYMRYSFAGGNDGVSENAAAWSAKYVFNERALYEMVGRTQDTMMAKAPPRDGHKKTILDPHATHVGIGMAWQGGEFRLVHLFIRRYLEWAQPLPRAARLGEDVVARGRAKDGALVHSISVHHESFPLPMPPHVVSAIDTYSLPANRRDYAPRSGGQQHVAVDSIQRARRQAESGADLQVTASGEFAFRVPFTEGPGIYTVVVWARRQGVPSPIAASNISIRVDSALQSPNPRAFGR